MIPILELIFGIRRVKRIFVSYSHDDVALVCEVVAVLRATDTKVFYDMDNIPPGAEWRGTIESSLRKATTVFVFWCRHASKSIEVANECKLAERYGKHIVPLLLDSTPLPADLARRQWIDLKHFRHEPFPPRIPPDRRWNFPLDVTFSMAEELSKDFEKVEAPHKYSVKPVRCGMSLLVVSVFAGWLMLQVPHRGYSNLPTTATPLQQPHPDISHLPSEEVLKLIYNSNAPAGQANSPKSELQCDFFLAMNDAFLFQGHTNGLLPMQNGSTFPRVYHDFVLGMHCLSPGCLYVFVIDSNGNLQVLFGGDSKSFTQVGNPVAAGQTIVVPQDPESVMSGNRSMGDEHFYFVCCEARWRELEQRLAAAEQASNSASTNPAPRFIPHGNLGVAVPAPATNAVVGKYLGGHWFEVPITSQPVQATNTHLVIERWFRPEDNGSVDSR